MGAWIETYTDESEGIGALVAPCVGAWIETNRYVQQASDVKSHPVWVRGLKLLCRALHVFHHYVAPCVGAWIETQRVSTWPEALRVAPCVGAWIETILS